MPVRLIAGLLYLKHMHNLSDEAVCARWLENPYWQFFTGEVWFQTRFPCDPSSLTRYRKRLGEAGLEELLSLTVETGKAMKAVSTRDLQRVIVGSTVQEKAVAYPTDSRLLEISPVASWCNSPGSRGWRCVSLRGRAASACASDVASASAG